MQTIDTRLYVENRNCKVLQCISVISIVVDFVCFQKNLFGMLVGINNKQKSQNIWRILI